MQDIASYTGTIYQAVGLCLEKRINFAAYRLPGNLAVTLVIQKGGDPTELQDITNVLPEKGFLIAPFLRNQEDKTCLIRPDIMLHGKATPRQLKDLALLPAYSTNGSGGSHPEDTQKEDYLNAIAQVIGKIRSGDFEKVVLSRVKSVIGNYYFRLPDIFSQICHTYPDAFVYLFCLKGQCWTGVSPEPFICTRDGELCTVSLAGTRTSDNQNQDIARWNDKELLEQEYVTRHIEKVLHRYGVDKYKKSGPYAAHAGNLVHLRTDFTFPVDQVKQKLPQLINALHPTPAVCGMSTGKAMDFIRTTEKHNREYYSGFLGPIGLDDMFQLYVNIRCMKVYDDRLVLYTGGGITHDSVAEAEWDETDIKADTLLSVLKQFN
jgi:isochorismate synthase